MRRVWFPHWRSRWASRLKAETTAARLELDARAPSAFDEVDPSWYLAAYPDVTASGVDPVEHYRSHGRAEGRLPNARAAALHDTGASHSGKGGGTGLPGWFEAAWYRSTNAVSDIGPFDVFARYLAQGRSEGRSPNRALSRLASVVVLPPLKPRPSDTRRQIEAVEASKVFDTEWYAETYEVDARNSVAHYVIAGAFLGYDPNPIFSSLDYFEANPDVAGAGGNPLAHYVLHGFAEGRRTATRKSASARVSARVWQKGF